MRIKEFIAFIYISVAFLAAFSMGPGYAEDLNCAAYVAQKSGLNLAVQYPKDWIIIAETEGKGNAFGRLTLHEPGHLDDDSVAANITISAKDSSEFDLETLKSESLVGRQEISSFKLISKRITTIGSLKALDLIMTYTISMPSWTGGSVFFPTKTRVVILQKDSINYIFKYECSEKEFDNFIKVFEYCVNTVKFPEQKKG